MKAIRSVNRKSNQVKNCKAKIQISGIKDPQKLLTEKCYSRSVRSYRVFSEKVHLLQQLIVSGPYHAILHSSKYNNVLQPKALAVFGQPASKDKEQWRWNVLSPCGKLQAGSGASPARGHIGHTGTTSSAVGAGLPKAPGAQITPQPAPGATGFHVCPAEFQTCFGLVLFYPHIPSYGLYCGPF